MIDLATIHNSDMDSTDDLTKTSENGKKSSTNESKEERKQRKKEEKLRAKKELKKREKKGNKKKEMSAHSSGGEESHTQVTLGMEGSVTISENDDNIANDLAFAEEGNHESTSLPQSNNDMEEKNNHGRNNMGQKVEEESSASSSLKDNEEYQILLQQVDMFHRHLEYAETRKKKKLQQAKGRKQYAQKLYGDYEQNYNRLLQNQQKNLKADELKLKYTIEFYEKQVARLEYSNNYLSKCIMEREHKFHKYVTKSNRLLQYQQGNSQKLNVLTEKLSSLYEENDRLTQIASDLSQYKEDIVNKGNYYTSEYEKIFLQKKKYQDCIVEILNMLMMEDENDDNEAIQSLLCDCQDVAIECEKREHDLRTELEKKMGTDMFG